jgi:non-ribosomal peptide synthetase component F
VALFGVRTAAAASGPLDPGSPPARLAFMVADADAARLLAHPLRSGSGRARLLLTEGRGVG